MSKYIVGVPVKEDARECFCKVVGNVNGGVNAFQADKVAFHPVTESEVFDINMASAGCGLLSISHSRTAVVILIDDGRGLLRDVQVPEDTANEERHPANIAGRHEFRFRGRQGNRGLEFCFVGNTTASELNTNATEQAAGLNTRGPVRITVGNGYCCVVDGTVVKK
jgi:hypothetical protein